MNKGVAYMALSISFFAVQNIAMKYLVHLPLMELVVCRALVAVGLAYATIRFKGIAPLGNNRRRLLLRGLLGFCALSMFVATVQGLPLGTALVIQYMSPVFVALLGIFVLKERMRWVQWLFFAVCMLGVALIRGFDPNVSTFLLLLGIGSSIVSAMAYATVRSLKDSDDPLVVTFYFPLVTIPLGLAAMGLNALLPGTVQVSHFGWTMPEGMDWFWLVCMGVFAQLGQIWMTNAYHAGRADVVSSVSYLGIVYGIVFGYFLFDETYAWQAALGIALVLAGVVANVLVKKVE